MSHGWDLSKLHIAELVPSEHNLSADSQLTVFNPSELELGETTASAARCGRSAPAAAARRRLAVRAAATSPKTRCATAGRFSRSSSYFSDRDCTVLMLDDRTGGRGRRPSAELAHGVVVLEQLANQYGAERRRLRVSKLRGVAFRGGFHDFAIRTRRPRRVSAPRRCRASAGLRRARLAERQPASSTACSAAACRPARARCCSVPRAPASRAIATLFATAAAARGERTAMFVFDENIGTFRSRSRKLGIPVDKASASGMITVQQIDPAELSSGEFVADRATGRGRPRSRPQNRRSSSSSTA